VKASSFEILVSAPAEWSHTGICASATKAGATGLIDAVFCKNRGHLVSQVKNLLGSISATSTFGLKIHTDQLSWIDDWKSALSNRPHTLLIQSPNGSSLPNPTRISAIGRRLLAELPSPPNKEHLDNLKGWDGLVLPGSEAAGFGGNQSSFVTAQRIPDLPLPVYCRGGISLQSAAACRIAGAAGVILEEAAWLLPDSPLDEKTKMSLRHLSGEETRTLGITHPLRAYVHPTFSANNDLQALLADEESAESNSTDTSEKIRSQYVGWGSLQNTIWPLGQAIGLAAVYANHFSNLSHLIQEIGEASQKLPAFSAEKEHLGPDSSLASDLGIQAGIVQGPMTRVSDVPAFASSISDGGAMPTLALALLNRERSLALLQEAKEKIGEKPWGAGILGFVPPELQKEQLEAILATRPPFVVIAGGRPDQAEQLEKEGIATFLHIPTPSLLRIFLKQGARRFIFEGRECGGHVGPLSSFVLWSRMVETLLEESVEPSSVQILFAGGIHNALSSAMATAMAAPLIEKGFGWGVLIGTSYLFTKEAVQHGAITETFQQQALQCKDTVCLPVAPGHANRCMQSQFADDFLARRRQLLTEQVPAEEIRNELEEFTLGRLRVATKGIERNSEGKLVKVSAVDQLTRGMFMVGETVTLRHELTDIRSLHDEIVSGSHLLLSEFSEKPSVQTIEAEPPVDIAVVGISTFLPDAADKDALWKNLMDRHVAVREIPKNRWDTRLHYDPDPDAPGKTVSKWGGLFPDVAVDLAKLGIPPASARHMSTSNLLCLEAARLALADAGYDKRPFDRENTAVILANADGGGHLGHALIVRALLGLFDPDTDPEVFERMPPLREESLPGTLTNVVSGRISNRMDLGGPNYTVDAACASSLATIDLAARELNSKRSNVVLAGASEIVMGPPAYVAFSKVGALSGTGKVRPFDESADGIALSDGIVFLVLKRLADAERDGDRIYSVIKGVGGSSDGKALGMTAPRPLGQKRALKRAYANAQFSPSTIGFYEAHATGTPVGDSAELETIIESLRSEGAEPDSCVISSSKGVLGHSRTAAGMAALVKSVLALHYKVLPPLSSVTKPLSGLEDPTTPVNVRRTPHPWMNANTTPRRAGVSAFGFGGTNFHVALEEYNRETAPRAPGGSRWPAEIVIIGGRDDTELKANAERWSAALAAKPDLKLADIAFTTCLECRKDGIAAVVSSKEELLECLKDLSANGSTANHRCLIAHKKDSDTVGKIAFLFPGQASQNIDMAGEIALFLNPLREALEKADQIGASLETGQLSRHIFPPTAFSPERLREQRNQLARTEIAQPAIGAISLGFLKLLQDIGVNPDVTAGHSYGEIPALVAAGRISLEDALLQSFLRGNAMSKAPEGCMAAVHSAPDEITSILKGFPDLVIANHNAPRQVIVAGPLEPLEALVEKLNSEGIRSSLLPVSGAFHSPLMADAQTEWSTAFANTRLESSKIPVFSAVTQTDYPDNENEARDLLVSQLTNPVSFVGTINHLYEKGVRTFVEVGPRNILTNLTAQILKGRDHTSIVLDDEGKGLSGLLTSISSLWAEGRDVDFSRLFTDRRVQRIEVDRLAALPPHKLSPTTWLINSSFVRQNEEEDGRYGTLPLLTLEERDKARQASQAKKAATVSANTFTSPTGIPSAGSTPSPMPTDAYAAYQETMREFLRLQETVMRQFSSGTSSPAYPANNTATAQPQPPAVFPSAPKPTGTISTPREEKREETAPEAQQPVTGKPLHEWTEEELLLHVTNIVSEKTGYPPEMLGADQDMEADLGIDSIKRIEILDVLQEKFSVAGDARALVRALGKKKTLREIAHSTLHFEEDSTEISPSVDVPKGDNPLSSPKPQELFQASPSFTMEERDANLSTPLPLPVGGLFLVTEDERGVADTVIQKLGEAGAKAVLLPRIALSVETTLIQTINDAREKHGQVRGFVHLAPLSLGVLPGDWEQSIALNIQSVFSILRHCSSDLQQTGSREMGRILTTSLLGGRFGRDSEGEGGPLTGGAGVGIIKTLDLEWPNVFSKAVDFNEATDSATIAERCMDELFYSTNQTEVGYCADQRRIFVPTKQTPAETSNFTYGEGEIVVATGGARGITAKCLHFLIGSGAHLIILGRSERDSSKIAPFEGCHDLPEIRTRILKDDNLRPKNAGPPEIEAMALQILHLLEVEQNIADIKALGVTVEYHSIDITDADKLRRTLKEIKTRTKGIHHFIHGAGVLADSLIENKPDSDLLKVIRTKIACLPVLAEELTDLKTLVLFASVSGRFGNYGQSDYAAANEVLNRFAWHFRSISPKTCVLSVNWGPWADGGMADPVVLKKLRERGIEPIEPQEGISYLRDALASSSNSCEVVVGSGPWAEDDINLQGAFDAGLFLLESNVSFRS